MPKSVKPYLKTFQIVLATFILFSCGPDLESSSSSPNAPTTSPNTSPISSPGQEGPNIVKTPGTPSTKTKPASSTTPPPSTIISKTIGDFSYQTKIGGSYPVIRYLQKNVVLNRDVVINVLADKTIGKDFRSIINESIADLPPSSGFNSYMLQAPIINLTAKNYPFYFIAIPTNIGHGGTTFNSYLLHCNPSPVNTTSLPYNNRFWMLFAYDDGPPPTFLTRGKNSTDYALPFGAAVFKGGYAEPGNAKEIMVVPCPVDKIMSSVANAPLGHIYSFAQFTDSAKNPNNFARLQSFWYAVGKTAQKMFDGKTVRNIDGGLESALYLSTHGHGVPYLHFRVENKASYYFQIPSLKVEGQSQNYYSVISW